MSLRILILFLAIALLGCGNNRKHIETSTDSLTGIKKEILTERFGEGGGIAGGSSSTERTITKHDKYGNLIYKSQLTSELNGCLMSISKWEVIAYKSDRFYQTFRLVDTIIIIRTYDPSNKMISEKKYYQQSFMKPYWMDISDNM